METNFGAMSAEQLRQSMTEKQYAFAEALSQGLEPLAAARKAGFGEKIAGAQAAKMLKNPKVIACRNALEAQKPEEELTAQWVWRKLAEVAERCMEQTPHMVWDKESRSYVHDGTWEFDAEGAIKALSAIGKLALGHEGGKTTERVGIEEFLEELEGGRRF